MASAAQRSKVTPPILPHHPLSRSGWLRKTGSKIRGGIEDTCLKSLDRNGYAPLGGLVWWGFPITRDENDPNYLRDYS